ncbi:MAG: YceI family protein [Candidatus Brocadiales bacterium]|nr:YceI family protein [Candidatus Brocadiales bacterium]
MPLKAGSYCLDTNSGELNVYTFKEGLLSKLAHDLLIDITEFKVNLEVPEAGFASGSLVLEIQANSLKVICALKDGEKTDALKEKDIADIERDMGSKVLHPDKYPTVNFRSKAIQEKEGGYKINGELSLHGVTKSIDFDIDTSGGNLKGIITLLQKDYGIKPFKAMMGTLKIKNEINIVFDLSLS